MTVKEDTYTHAQVDALLECIDLLDNGYVMRTEYTHGRYHYIALRHRRTGKRICMWVYPERYMIFRNGVKVKESRWNDVQTQFIIYVDSDNKVRYRRIEKGVSQ